MDDEARLLAEKYNGVVSEAFLRDKERLVAGEPLAYLIGHIPFLDTTIYLDSHPLIPRPETEFWTEKAIEDIKARGLETPRILDLCAGSGAIGVAVAQAIPRAHVDFVEIDESHIATIKRNLKENGIEESRTHILTGDLFENVTEKYDFILSNPPYIDPDVDQAEPSVKAHEPHLALYGGQGGLELITRIIAESPAHLAPGGTLYIEHEPEQAEAIRNLASEHGFTITTHHDQYSIERFSTLQ